MWSAWPEMLDVYLGQSLVMVGRRGAATIVQRHSATLPLAQAIERLSVEQEFMSHVGARHPRLRITLSGALCPAIGFSAPKEVTRHAELIGIARSAVAQKLGGDTEDWLCALDPAQRGLAAAMSTHLSSLLFNWAAQLGGEIASVGPSWALTSQCLAVREPQVKAVLLSEPDSSTYLAEYESGEWAGDCALGVPAGDTVPAELRRWLVGQGFHENQVAKLGFAPDPASVMQDGPKTWSKCWYRR